MRLGKLLRGGVPTDRPRTPGGGSAQTPPRRRRAIRPDGPRTIVPTDDATPSWLPARPSSPMALELDAARERLRRAIPPVDDDLE